jgi:hypothetical protein
MRLLLIQSVVLCFGATQVHTQLDLPGRTEPADSILARFEHDVRTHAVPALGPSLVSQALRDARAPLARRDSVLDGLESMALTSESRETRQAAALYLAVAGESERTPPMAGIVERLLRIYRGNPTWLVRSTVMDQLPRQHERHAAAAFLRTVAAERDTSTRVSPVHGHFTQGDLRTAALARLAEMGDDGRAVLQAMHRNGEARSPQARIVLDDMARRGFPVIDVRRPPRP